MHLSMPFSYIPPEKLTLDKLAQFYVECKGEEEKFRVLDEIYSYVTVGQSIIFTHVRLAYFQYDLVLLVD